MKLISVYLNLAFSARRANFAVKTAKSDKSFKFSLPSSDYPELYRGMQTIIYNTQENCEFVTSNTGAIL